MKSFAQQNTTNKRRFELQYKQPEQNRPSDVPMYCMQIAKFHDLS